VNFLIHEKQDSHAGKTDEPRKALALMHKTTTKLFKQIETASVAEIPRIELLTFGKGFFQNVSAPTIYYIALKGH